MFDIIRDSTFGTLVNHLTGGRVLPYRDQLPNYQIPERYLKSLRDSTVPSSPATRVPSFVEGDVAKKDPEAAHIKLDPYIVDWDGDDDPDNPHNWSSGKRSFVLFSICVLTFSIYIGSAIYTPSIPGIMKDFGVSSVVATLGLSLYVLAYGIGPMVGPVPLQELPSLGRNPVYMITLLIFVLLQIPTALAPNIGSLLVLRFLSGFFASPALATGGASIQDIYAPQYLAYTIGLWAMSAVAGPVTGPIVGGFAAQKEGWRWPLWELLWISGFSFVFLFFLFPETYPDTILLKRARRLRKLTGNPNLRSLSEIKQAQMSPSAVAQEALIRPFQLMMEPAVFSSTSISDVSIFTITIFITTRIHVLFPTHAVWFEAFPLVFVDIYHFKLGVSGLPFIGIIVGAVWMRTGGFPPEERLKLAIVSGFAIPISLFIFGWTSRPSVHWIAPVIGAAIYMPGIYLLFQCVLVYLPMAYPHHAASVYAANDFFRSTLASAFPLIGRAFFHNLGIGPGCSLLAGIALGMIPILYLLMRRGATLRAHSKYATA
ncbi:hypothetical protein BS47DRAFT_1373151 [Hydnum rufescens UP504]|uniref:Major facilitator superfamily (MFS) profile domain-containing protein n=1 Tax=Hydnum rufescens UP504 TaxID=1448309 RepID=A0A9P6ATD2_9AGAM|nr:hypothetical protein BS47DRAFT_1373151 [Hydnum rufescens UP504]